MKAIILAGGQGDRLGTLTDHQPKALVEVAGKELLRYTLDLLDHPKIDQIGVVVGYHSKAIIQFLRTNYKEVKIFETPHYDKGSIMGLECAYPFLDRDFLLMNSDHIYPRRLLKRFLEQTGPMTVACDFDRPLVADDMKIKKDPDGNLKEIHKQLKDYDGGYIGMTFCSAGKIPVYKKAAQSALKALGHKACVEMTLAELAKTGEKISIGDVSGIRWLEIDTPEDLQKAQITLKQEKKFLA